MPAKTTQRIIARKRSAGPAKKSATTKPAAHKRWTATRLRLAPYSMDIVYDILLSLLTNAVNTDVHGLVYDALEEIEEAAAYQHLLERRLAKATNRPLPNPS